MRINKLVKAEFIHAIYIAVFVCNCNNGQTTSNAHTNLSPKEFANKIHEKTDAIILDVRSPNEFSKGHLDHAMNIDWNGSSFEDEVRPLDKSKPVFVYCLSGGRSSAAASQMRSDGFKEVYELNGGILKWRAANLPESTTDENAGKGMTPEQFEKLLETDKLVLIDFYADWCAPCKRMEPYLKEISSDLSDKVIVVRIDADNNQVICKELQVDGLPVLQLYKNKILIWKNFGYIEKESVVTQINSN